nr:(Fe-S)-binding protein [Candidatus Sigynarchaeota archaeon]
MHIIDDSKECELETTRNNKGYRRYKRGAFKRDACTSCGICFANCPSIHLSVPDAKKAIDELAKMLENIDGLDGPAGKILAGCTTCMACNVACPNDCRPTNLIQDIWYAAYKKGGLPIRAEYFVHHNPVNYRTYVIEHLPDQERRLVESWKNLAPVDEILYPGCTILTMPYLLLAKRDGGLVPSKLFEGMVARGSIDNCCGETYFRSGLFDVVEQVAKRATHYFRDILKVKKVVCICNACGDVFANILPQFGAELENIEFVPYIKVLHDKLKSGELPIVKSFKGKTITIQEACHAKIYEENYYDYPRNILKMLGFEIIEAKQYGDSNICCGIGYGFSRASSYSKLAIIKGSTSCLKNAVSTKADIACTYCAGCQAMLSVAKLFRWTRKPVYYITELVQLAIGEVPVGRHGPTARSYNAGANLKQKRGKQMFFVPDISSLPHSKF